MELAKTTKARAAAADAAAAAAAAASTVRHSGGGSTTAASSGTDDGEGNGGKGKLSFKSAVMAVQATKELKRRSSLAKKMDKCRDARGRSHDIAELRARRHAAVNKVRWPAKTRRSPSLSRLSAAPPITRLPIWRALYPYFLLIKKKKSHHSS